MLTIRSVAAVAGMVLLAVASATSVRANDFPTEARADYVFGCMASNGQTQDALRRCSCSIDVIASIIPYERYVEAETVMRMRLVGGEKTVMFRVAPSAKSAVDDLKRAQVESEIRCF